MEIVELIGNFGFPISITTYLLIRLEKKLEALTEAINKLNS